MQSIDNWFDRNWPGLHDKGCRREQHAWRNCWNFRGIHLLDPRTFLCILWCLMSLILFSPCPLNERPPVQVLHHSWPLEGSPRSGNFSHMMILLILCLKIYSLEFYKTFLLTSALNMCELIVRGQIRKVPSIYSSKELFLSDLGPFNALHYPSSVRHTVLAETWMEWPLELKMPTQ